MSALDAAYRKGLMSCLVGEPVESCPYDDKRKASGRITWSRAFRRAWVDGWEHAKTHPEDARITLSIRAK